MNSTWSRRRRWYSCSIGSLTLSSRSADAQTSSAVGHDVRAHGREVGVGEGAADARAALDEHVVPGADELARPGRGQRNAVLVVLDLAGYTDSHALMVKIVDD